MAIYVVPGFDAGRVSFKVSFKSWKYLETLVLKDGVFEKEKFFCYMVVDQSNLHLDYLVSVQYILFIVHDPMFLSLDESWYKNNVSTLKPVLVCTVGVR